jgi:serralysin
MIATSVSYKMGADTRVETLRTTSNGGVSAIDLTGNAFAQTIMGNNGANRIDAKGGADLLYGRGGDDTFVFSAALTPGNVDHIADFGHTPDTIELAHAVFADISVGVLDAAAFHVGTAASTVDHRIIYDNTTGTLRYDADGAGGVAAVQFAILDNHAGLNASDFLVV